MSVYSLPHHIAVVMDGNGRWAKKRFLPRKAGHRAGAKAVRLLLENCITKSIKVLTLFAFSSENWKRPDDEIETLMNLFLENLQAELPLLQQQKVRLSVIGERERFSEALQSEIAAVEKATEKNDGLRLNLAVSYGGRWDIVQAVKKIAEQVKIEALTPKDIDETTFSQYLCLAELPVPDLFIRTSGEQRLSNFLLWQLAYTELYFSSVYWPDFDSKEFEKALDFFAHRDRRFGNLADTQPSEPSN